MPIRFANVLMVNKEVVWVRKERTIIQTGTTRWADRPRSGRRAMRIRCSRLISVGEASSEQALPWVELFAQHDSVTGDVELAQALFVAAAAGFQHRDGAFQRGIAAEELQ